MEEVEDEESGKKRGLREKEGPSINCPALCGKLRFNSHIQEGERGLVSSRRRSYTRRTRPSCILHGHHLAAHCVVLYKGTVAKPRRRKEAAYHQRAKTTLGIFVEVIHQPEKEKILT